MIGTDASGYGVRASRLEYVPALDGVRGVAVAMVLVYHLDISFLPGGFLGVDLFFVLSGFLITRLLLLEYRERQTIDLVGFWLRRARRLLPALFLVLAPIALWAAQVSPYERDSMRWDILSAIAYVANWRFIVAGNSYFEEFATPSPITHLWSLAIEEQFYLVWPVLVLGVLALTRRRAWGNYFAVGGLVAGIGASLALLAVAFDPYDPSVAYYGTHTRAHELLIGAVGAVAVTNRDELGEFLRRLAGWAGPLAFAVLLGVSVVLPDSSSAYYFGGSLIFSLWALLLILSVTSAPSTMLSRALAFAPLRWLGIISYGVYLWHWPVILWLTPESTNTGGLFLAFLQVTVTLSLSAASFVLVERPIRTGWRGRHVSGPRIAHAAIVAVLVLSTVTVINTRGAQPIPEFVSNNRNLLVSEVPQARATVGLIGDSVAMSLYPGLAYESAAQRLTLVAATFPGCPVGLAERVDDDGAPFAFMKTCPKAVLTGQTTMIERFGPGVVFWLGSSEKYDIREGERILQAGTPEWERAVFADWDEILDRLTIEGAHVVLILPLHWADEDPTYCDVEDVLARLECTEPDLTVNALRFEYSRWAAMHPADVTVIDPDPALCPENPCPRAIDGTVLRRDKLHFTKEGSLLATRRLLELLPSGIWTNQPKTRGE